LYVPTQGKSKDLIMNTHTLPRTLRLHRAPWRSLTDRFLDAAQQRLARWMERRAARHEAELALAVERELRHLDPRTLDDIGAPQGLIGQRRWQSEQERWQQERTLRSQSW
jgi:hypothetical protein